MGLASVFWAYLGAWKTCYHTSKQVCRPWTVLFLCEGHAMLFAVVFPCFDGISQWSILPPFESVVQVFLLWNWYLSFLLAHQFIGSTQCTPWVRLLLVHRLNRKECIQLVVCMLFCKPIVLLRLFGPSHLCAHYRPWSRHSPVSYWKPQQFHLLEDGKVLSSYARFGIL